MARLAGTEPGGMAQLERVLVEYEAWIEKRKTQAAALEGAYRLTAERHIADCTRALKRMREGLELVRDPHSLTGRAFRLANAAMLKQQLRSGASLRTTELVDGRLHVSGSQPDEKPQRKSAAGGVLFRLPFFSRPFLQPPTHLTGIAQQSS